MKTTYKILLCGLGLMIIAVIWAFLDRALAQSSVAALRTALSSKYDRPPFEPGQSAEAQVVAYSASSTVNLTSLWEEYHKLPQLMCLTSGGSARVAWREEGLHTTESTNAWPDVHSALSTVDKEIRFLLDAADEKSGLSDTDRAMVIQQGGLAYAWLGVAMSAELQAGAPDAAWVYLKAALFHAKVAETNMNWMWNVGHVGVLSAVWEFLQQTGLNEAQLRELNSAVGEFRGPSEWDRHLYNGTQMMSSWFHATRTQPELLSRASPLASSTSIVSWGDFFNAIPNDPNAAFAWLMAKPKHWKYRWRDSFRDEHWMLTELAIDWDATKVGLESGAMTNALEWARRQRAAHGPPGSALIWSTQALQSLRAPGTTTSPDHVHVLTKLIAEETRRRLLTTAVALHRYQLRNGSFPGSLVELTPELLPVEPLDMLDGKPLRYRRRQDGTFLLYSIGCYDGDNGGNGNHTFPASSRIPSLGQFSDWPGRLDWVWPSVATRAEVEALNSSLKSGSTPRVITTSP